MARLSALDSARLRRDLGLARARRLTVSVAIGATAFTGVTAVIAATSLPGRAAASNNSASQSGNTGAGISGVSQPGFTGPVQPPQYGYVPVVVSGGS